MLMRALPLTLILLCLSATVPAAPEHVTVQLIWKHQFQFAGYYIAQQKGFYAAQDLDVVINEYQRGIDPVKSVLQGDVEFAVGRPSIMIDMARGADIIALFAAYQSSPLMLLSLQSSGISKPTDLRGRKVMMTAGANRDADLVAMLLREGVTSTDYLRQPHSFKLQDLIDGKTDAMASYVSNEPFHLEQNGIPYNILHPKDYGFEIYSDILFTSKQLLANKPELVDRFYKASLLGWKYAFENIDETAQIIFDHYNTQQRSLEALKFEGRALRKLAFDNKGEFGSLSAERLASISHLYLVTGAIQSAIQLKEYIYQDSLNQSSLTKSQQKWLSDHSPLRICINPNWMPYERYDRGRYQGIIADYMQLIQQHLNTGTQLIQTQSWAQTLEKMLGGSCDLLTSAMQTPTNSQYLSFSRPYLSMPVVMAIHQDTDELSIEQLRPDQPLVFIRGSAMQDILATRYPTLSTRTVDSIREGLFMIDQGKAYGFVGTSAGIRVAMETHHIMGLKLSRSIHDNWDISIAVPSKDPTLVTILDSAIQSITPEEHQQILDRWITPTQPTVEFKYLWQVIAFATAILMLISYRYHVIRNYSAKLELLAQRDPLTGLYNRNKMRELLDQLAATATRYNRPLSLIFMDIDHFKMINDQHGHNAGDDVLRETAKVMHDNLRQTDIAGRWGGEEFLILLPETTAENALESAEKLRQIISQHSFPGNLRETCSFGITAYYPGENTETFVDRADHAMYLAKGAGRNNCRLSQSTTIYPSTNTVKVTD